MCILCQKDNIKEIKDLRCCKPFGVRYLHVAPMEPALRAHIPLIEGLDTFYCYNSPLLTYIPLISGLKTLNCQACPLITCGGSPIQWSLPLRAHIPLIDGLQVLNCVRTFENARFGL